MNSLIPRKRSIATLLLTLAALLATIPSYAQLEPIDEPQKRDSVAHKTTFYYAIDQGWWIEKLDMAAVKNLVSWVKENTTAKIKIEAYTDPSGNLEYNNRLSINRARTAQRHLVKSGIDADRITYEGRGVDHSKSIATEARRADIVAYKEVAVIAEPTPQPTPEPEEAAQITAQTSAQIPAQTTVESVHPASDLQNLASEPNKCNIEIDLRTNLLYWLGGMMNLGVEWRPNKTNLGVLVNGGYSPIGGANWAHAMGGWFLSPELRYYLPCNEHWFVGAQFMVGALNVKLSDIGRQGDMLGGGVLGGYKMTLSENFDMDFTLGVGYGSFKYETYHHSNGVNVLDCPYVHRCSVMPVQAGVNLIWKIKGSANSR